MKGRFSFFRVWVVLLCLCALLPLPGRAAARAAAPPVALTEEEQAYLGRAGELVVGCPVNNCPLLFQDERTGELKGIAIDILDMVAESTGLTFRYQALPAGDVTFDDLRRLQVDLVAGVEYNPFNQNSSGLALTDTYLHTAKVFVCRGDTVFDPDSAMTVATCSGSQTLKKVIQEQYPLFETVYYDTTESALSALLDGEADVVLQNQYTVERLLRKPIYEDLQIVATASIGDSQCLGCLVPIDGDGESVLSPDAQLLLSILNKGIDSLDQAQVSFLIIKETSENPYQYTLGDMLYHYRYAAAGLLASLGLILFLLWNIRQLHQRRTEEQAAQQRAKELAVINAQMEEQQLLLMDALKRAEEGNRAKSTFLFNMSHDIRTPMNAILGFADIAGRSLEDPVRLADCLEKIQSSGKHLLQLINNVLDMAKIESGKVDLAEESCDLIAAIQKARDILQVEIDQKGLLVRTDTSAVTDRWVCCDGLRLDQILFNLLSNAIKFTPPGGHIWITLKQTPQPLPEYAGYELRVRDDGVGMAPEFLAHIFEPFERERTSTLSQTQGTGLGMPITKNLVDLMGGTIQVTSRPGAGSEFTLNFTFRPQAPARQPEAPQPHRAAYDFTGLRLLLVDDNELNMEIAQELLQEAGFLVETAENGQVAVDMVRTSAPGHYAAVLMDIQMPVMDGYQASRTIRALADPALAKIPIIALTANAFDEDKREALSNGMNAHIAKPLDPEVLYETLQAVLGER